MYMYKVRQNRNGRKEASSSLISGHILLNLVSLERAESAIYENGIIFKNRPISDDFLTCFIHEVVSIGSLPPVRLLVDQFC